MSLLGASREETCRSKEHAVDTAKGAQCHENRHHKGQRPKHLVAKGYRNGQRAKHLRFGHHSKVGQIDQHINPCHQWHGYPNGSWQISARKENI